MGNTEEGMFYNRRQNFPSPEEIREAEVKRIKKKLKKRRSSEERYRHKVEKTCHANPDDHFNRVLPTIDGVAYRVRCHVDVDCDDVDDDTVDGESALEAYYMLYR
jgi:hypothetical protein